MKTLALVLLTALPILTPLRTHAQAGGRPAGPPAGVPSSDPGISPNIARLFGDNAAFSADLEIQSKPVSGEMSVLGKIAFDHGKVRFDMDLASIKAAKMPPQAVAHMKAMGMDKVILVSRPDQKASYTIYPGPKAYLESSLPESRAADFNAERKLETTELAKEAVDGHPCVKNRAVVIDKDNKQLESTTWNATDLKNFPIKIETTESGTPTTMSFKNVELSKPSASLFEPPADFTKYSNVMEMMQQMMSKRLGGSGGPPAPPQAPTKKPIGATLSQHRLGLGQRLLQLPNVLPASPRIVGTATAFAAH